MHLRNKRKNPPRRKNKRRCSRVKAIDSRFLTRKRLKTNPVQIQTQLKPFPRATGSNAATCLRKIINSEKKGKEKKLRNSLGNRKLRVLRKMRRRLIKDLVSKRSFLREEMRKELNEMTNLKKQEDVANSTESDCIIIDEPPEVIVLEDDDNEPNRTDYELPTVINEQQTIEIDDENDVNGETGDITTTFLNSTNLKNIHQSTPIATAKSLSLFYEDITPGTDLTQIPTYETIRSEEDTTLLNNETQLQDDVIVIDTPTKSKTLTNGTQSDDSVIFLNEIIDLDRYNKKFINENNNQQQIAANFIPLDHTKLNPKSILGSIVQPLKTLKGFDNIFKTAKNSVPVKLFNSTEQRANESYNKNLYNPNKNTEFAKGKRMVLVDGSNVAYGHSLRKEFSVKGLVICLEYFDKLGHEVKAIVPQFRLQKSKSTDPGKLLQLHSEGKIIFTPCKNLPGKSSCSYDDRFILQLAVEFDAAVISNDNYRDLINENEQFKKIIENRVIGYTWCNDLFILPKDPYGRNGPALSCILNRV